MLLLNRSSGPDLCFTRSIQHGWSTGEDPLLRSTELDGSFGGGRRGYLLQFLGPDADGQRHSEVEMNREVGKLNVHLDEVLDDNPVSK